VRGVASEASWKTLATRIKDQNITPRLDERVVPDPETGRPGVARSIVILLPGRGLVTVRDTSWRGLWTGFQVTRDDRDGYVMRSFPKRKRFSEVVNDVCASVMA
jgi:hypothetical protein